MDKRESNCWNHAYMTVHMNCYDFGSDDTYCDFYREKLAYIGV